MSFHRRFGLNGTGRSGLTAADDERDWMHHLALATSQEESLHGFREAGEGRLLPNRAFQPPIHQGRAKGATGYAP